MMQQSSNNRIPPDTGLSSRVVPYNTGKVLIGCRYQPPVRVPRYLDDDRLQSALLGISAPMEDRAARFLVRGLPWVVLVLVLASMAFLMGFGGRHAG